MEEDVGIGGADGFSDADFVGAFGDGDEHDVHDADTTDEKGNAGYEGEHAGDDLEEGAGGVGDLVAVGYAEVDVAGFGGFEGIGDGGGDGGEVGGGFYFDVDLLDLEVLAEFFELGGFEEGGAIEIDVVEIDGVIGCVEDADDNEFLTESGEGFADGYVGTVEIHGELMADDGGVLGEVGGEE